METKSLQNLAKSLLLERTELPEMECPDLALCLRVGDISDPSPASIAGLRTGDLLVSVNNQSAAETPVCAGAILEFYNGEKSGIRLRCESRDLGAHLHPSIELIKARFHANSPNCLDLFSLWCTEEFQLLENFVTKSLLAQNQAGFFDRLRKKLKPIDSPLTALHGAVLFEKGQRAEGLRWLTLYQVRFASHHKQSYFGLCEHYQAIASNIIQDLSRCSHRYRFNLTRQILEKMGENEPRYSLKPFLTSVNRYLCSEENVSPTLFLVESSPDTRPLLRDFIENNQTLLQGSGTKILTISEEPWTDEGLGSEGLRHQHLTLPLDSLPSATQITNDVLLLSPDYEVLGRLGDQRNFWSTLHMGSEPLPKVVTQRYDQSTKILPQHSASKRRAFRSGVQEKVCYLLPILENSIPETLVEPESLPQGWEISKGDNISLKEGVLSLKVLDYQAASSWLGRDVFDHFAEVILSNSTEKEKLSNTFYLVEGKCSSSSDFGLHQAALLSCRHLCGLGCLGAWDSLAQRWLSREALEGIEPEIFDIKDHISIQIQNNLCCTHGLSKKFGAPEYAMRLEQPHLAGAVVYLLNTIAEQIVHGKVYSEKDLFRWRSGIQICQLLFRPLNPDADDSCYEAVDMLLENKVIRSSSDASACLKYFTEAAPHWDLSFGWPPRSRPNFDSSSHPVSIFGLLPGMPEESSLIFGEPSNTRAQNTKRWLFSDPLWDSPIRIEVTTKDGVIQRIESNTLRVQDQDLSDRNSLSYMESLLGKPTLTRTFLALPDRSLVRTECVWIQSDPEDLESSFLCNCLFDYEYRLWKTEVTRLAVNQEKAFGELQSSYGRAFLTGHADRRPLSREELSDEARAFRTWLESTMELVQSLSLQFGKTAWLGDELRGLSLVVGGYLKNRRVPSAELLEEIGLPSEHFLDYFEDLHLYLYQTSTQNTVSELSYNKNVDPMILGAFLWLMKESSFGDDEPRLALDLAQVYQQYQIQLSQIRI